MADEQIQQEAKEDPGFDKLVDEAGHKQWLGDYKVVNGLLRSFVKEIFSKEAGEDELEDKARSVARIFLGMDAQYPGPKWNRAGQIDVYIAKQEGIQSDNPVDIIAGGILNMVGELLELAENMGDGWEKKASTILKEYSHKFLGIPLMTKDVDLK